MALKKPGATRGGARPGAGRPKGGKNAATLEIEAAAKRFAGDALKALVHVAKRGKSESARVAAAEAILSRGYGRPRQAIEHSGKLEGTGVLGVPVPMDSAQWAATAAAQQSLSMARPATAPAPAET